MGRARQGKGEGHSSKRPYQKQGVTAEGPCTASGQTDTRSALTVCVHRGCTGSVYLHKAISASVEGPGSCWRVVVEGRAERLSLHPAPYGRHREGTHTGDAAQGRLRLPATGQRAFTEAAEGDRDLFFPLLPSLLPSLLSWPRLAMASDRDRDRAALRGPRDQFAQTAGNKGMLRTRDSGLGTGDSELRQGAGSREQVGGTGRIPQWRERRRRTQRPLPA